MPNDKPLNNNAKALASISKWSTQIIIVVLAAFVLWIGRTVWEIDRRHASYKGDLQSMADDRASMKEDVAANSTWIREWYDTLRVPERDQRQDSAIATLELAVTELKVRLREIERQYAQLGGPNDPLYKEIERLQRAIERLDDSQ